MENLKKAKDASVSFLVMYYLPASHVSPDNESRTLDHFSRFLFKGSIPCNCEPLLAAYRLYLLESFSDDVNIALIVMNIFTKILILFFTQT